MEWYVTFEEYCHPHLLREWAVKKKVVMGLAVVVVKQAVLGRGAPLQTIKSVESTSDRKPQNEAGFWYGRGEPS